MHALLDIVDYELQPNIDWLLLKSERELESNWFAFVDNELVGFLLAAYYIDKRVELKFFVNPQAENENIFSQLLIQASHYFERIKITQLQFSVSSQNQFDVNFMHQLKSEYQYTEQTLNLEIKTYQPEKCIGELVQAKQSDCKKLSELDVKSFGSDLAEIHPLFKKLLVEENRKAFLYYKNKQCIGKCHAKIIQDTIWLHDIAILPEYQNKGCGEEMINELLLQIKTNMDLRRVALVVNQNNLAAIALYDKLGFQLVRTDEYWLFAL